MPSTRSSAATKCISEVPGLEKQTLTPPLTSVRTRLSAPFIDVSFFVALSQSGRTTPLTPVERALDQLGHTACAPDRPGPSSFIAPFGTRLKPTRA